MSIYINQDLLQFHLTNGQISYIFYIGPTHQPVQLYTGPHIEDADYTFLEHQQSRPVSNYMIENDTTFSHEHTLMEYPSFGSTDFRSPAFEVRHPDGSHITNLEYEHYEVRHQAPVLKDLPHVRQSQQNVETLIIYLIDPVSQLRVKLYYSLFDDMNIIARHTEFENTGVNTLTLTRALSMNLDLMSDSFSLVHLSGAWGRERHVTQQSLSPGTFEIQSLRGHSSHLHHPFFALAQPNTTENSGLVYGMSFAYSGNFLGHVEVDNFNKTRASIGIHPEYFSWQLTPGTQFTTPQAYLAIGLAGFNDMSQQFHRLVHTYLIAPQWRNQPRPILINNWEATYYDFTEDKLVAIAEKAKELGIEMFVLDDGWFGSRNNDQEGLGDFFINKTKLPKGLQHLNQRINDLGLDFGLWMEPEMVNKQSKLYATHPEWVIQTPNRTMSHGRFQFVLDYTNPDVIDYIYHEISNILDHTNIKYIKWDMNRSMTEVFSSRWPTEQQGEIYHRYILGLYDLLHRITTRFPNILIESCASGGGRFDLGMLYYTPQIWTSDNTDAYQRQWIQYGTSYLYPTSTMGTHVSKSPNEQEHRLMPLTTRANVSYFGTFGYELDLTTLDQTTLETMKQQVAFMKTHRNLLQFGKFFRLLNPSQNEFTAWMVIDHNRNHAIIGIYKHLNKVNNGRHRVVLKGLDPSAHYHIPELDLIMAGNALMAIGIDIPDTSNGELRNGEAKTHDFDSWLYTLERV
ncbi:alpha-galactosidase [Staphylococcus coagulans]|uniref:Alpha-galactosidase n=1 Tax=Staphylococcus coagulans TaxID=74706 RepID=A0A9X0TMU9_9STAP|nr:alpha-galactosidase [Staphylococcus coagulans]MBA8772463.1 alpha-galactosidase [Staphylococcus coagulans]MBA8776694.1 alpha-galactosidase [Staphylococcus coagulans]